MKSCNICGETKPFSEFYRTKKYYSSKCKVCNREYCRAYSRAYCRAHRPVVKNVVPTLSKDIKRISRRIKEREKRKDPIYRKKKNALLRKWQIANPDKVREAQKRVYCKKHGRHRIPQTPAISQAEKNKRAREVKKNWSPEKIALEKEKARQYYQNNKAKIQKQSKEYYRENREARSEYGRNNRDMINARSRLSGKHSLRSRRKVAWRDNKAIRKVYRECRKLSTLYGMDFHVDHVIPLHGDTISGLHVWENLQVLEGRLNEMKSNGYYPNGFPYINLMN